MAFLITKEILGLLPSVLCNRKRNICNISYGGYFSMYTPRMATLISTHAPSKSELWWSKCVCLQVSSLFNDASSLLFPCSLLDSRVQHSRTGLPCPFLVEASPQIPLAGQIRHIVFKRNVCLGAAYIWCPSVSRLIKSLTI